MESRCPKCREHLIISKGGGGALPRGLCASWLWKTARRSCGHFNPIPGKDEVVDVLKQILKEQKKTNDYLEIIMEK